MSQKKTFWKSWILHKNHQVFPFQSTHIWHPNMERCHMIHHQHIHQLHPIISHQRPAPPAFIARIILVDGTESLGQIVCITEVVDLEGRTKFHRWFKGHLITNKECGRSSHLKIFWRLSFGNYVIWDDDPIYSPPNQSKATFEKASLRKKTYLTSVYKKKNCIILNRYIVQCSNHLGNCCLLAYLPKGTHNFHLMIALGWLNKYGHLLDMSAFLELIYQTGNGWWKTPVWLFQYLSFLRVQTLSMVCPGAVGREKEKL